MANTYSSHPNKPHSLVCSAVSAQYQTSSNGSLAQQPDAECLMVLSGRQLACSLATTPCPCAFCMPALHATLQEGHCNSTATRTALHVRNLATCLLYTLQYALLHTAAYQPSPAAPNHSIVPQPPAWLPAVVTSNVQTSILLLHNLQALSCWPSACCYTC